jgi:transposase
MMNIQSGSCDFWVGVDLAQDSFQAAWALRGLDLSAWRSLPQASFANTSAGMAALARWVAAAQHQSGGCCVGLVVEATGGLSRRFAEAAAPLQLPPVSILNPAYVKAFGQSLGQRSKNDKLDAAVLAAFGAVHQPLPAAKLTPLQERLRELDRLRQGLVEQQTAWQNSLREARDPLARKMIGQQLKLLESQIKAIEEQIDRLIDQDPDLRQQRRLLDSVPGIGPRVAATILAELGDLARYRRDALVGYVGLFSRERRSGKRQRRGGAMVKGGGARVRRVLGMAAMALMRSKCPLKEFNLRLQAAGKTKLSALVALMRKLLLIARAVVVSGQCYDPLQALRACPQKEVACG